MGLFWLMIVKNGDVLMPKALTLHAYLPFLTGQKYSLILEKIFLF